MIKKTTIRDVAREAGVSVTLVSFVMNAKVKENGELDCPVNAETAERVLQVAKRLGYKRNNAAASLRSGRTRTIAVITSDISSPFFAEICRHLENIAYRAGYTVLFASSDESAQKLSHLIDKMIGYNVEGLIVAPCAGSEKVLHRSGTYNIPTVLIDRNIPGDAFGRVLVDNEAGGYEATRYLIGNGHTRIEIIGYDIEIASVSDRVKGYERAMKEAGLEDNIQVNVLPYGISPSADEVAEVFRSAHARGTDAFVLPTKKLSKSGFYAMTKLNLRMHRDFDFVCYDESDVYDLIPPGIPHMVQPLHEIAEKSFNLLLDIIDNKPAEMDVTLHSHLVKGGA